MRPRLPCSESSALFGRVALTGLHAEHGQAAAQHARCPGKLWVPAIALLRVRLACQLALLPRSDRFRHQPRRIDGHRMRVVALDGLPVQMSSPLRAIRINAGQRVTVAVCPDATHPAGKPAWIRAEMEQVC